MGKKIEQIKNKVKLGLCSVRNKNITKAARYFLKIMFNNGSQFVGLTPRPIKSKIIFSIRALNQQFVINYRFIIREIL